MVALPTALDRSNSDRPNRMAEAYLAGRSVAEIAAEEGVSKPSVYSALKMRGIPRYRRKPEPTMVHILPVPGPADETVRSVPPLATPMPEPTRSSPPLAEAVRSARYRKPRSIIDCAGQMQCLWDEAKFDLYDRGLSFADHLTHHLEPVRRIAFLRDCSDEQLSLMAEFASIAIARMSLEIMAGDFDDETPY